MFIITYPVDDAFLRNDLVWLAQQTPKFQQWHDLLLAACADARVQLAVRHDLAPAVRAAAKPGAPALPANVTVCLAVTRRLMGWSYRTAMHELSVNAGWRWVCQLYLQPVPNFRTIQNREAKLTPKTIRLINQVVVVLGQRLGVTKAEKLRVDGSVTETNIHYPTDSSLLDDSARVLSRLVRQVRDVVQPRSPADKARFRDRHRQAHRLARDISRLTRSKAKNTGKSSLKLYGQLLAVVETLVAQIAEIRPRLAGLNASVAGGLKEMFDHYLPLVQQVIDQTRKRVIESLSVAASDKVVSLFEPHTAIICRGKPKDTEFGRKIWYGEVDGGLISEYRLLVGNPDEAQYLLPSVQHHRQLFGKLPKEVCGDRGIHSARNEKEARALGVRRVSLPQPGYKTNRRHRREKQSWFRAAQRFRNGIEGRISQLRRARGLDRCLAHGDAGMERWVGWGVIANNLATIAQFLIKHRRGGPWPHVEK
ncbi:MAG: ISNCY family transposase [Planctomycetota bacterium]